MPQSKKDLKRVQEGVTLEGYLEIPHGVKIRRNHLVPVKITLVSKRHFLDDRNKRILAMKRADPTLSCQAIALLMGVTRQRVFQILKANGVTAKRKHRKHPPKVTPLSEFEEM